MTAPYPEITIQTELLVGKDLVQIECKATNVDYADPSVGIMSDFIDDWTMIRLDTNQCLTTDEYAQVSESELDRIGDLLTEMYLDMGRGGDDEELFI